MDSRLDEIKARAEKAMPGPWKTVEHGNTVKSHAIVAINHDVSIIPIAAGISPKTKDANFIANSREDIPYLLDQITALQQENKKDYKDMRKFQGEYIRLIQENAVLKSELSELKKALELACISMGECTMAHGFPLLPRPKEIEQPERAKRLYGQFIQHTKEAEGK